MDTIIRLASASDLSFLAEHDRHIALSELDSAIRLGRVQLLETAEGEPIFCFPQIPLFYVLTDRPDPGTFTKVQWFDVASDKAILQDIDTLRQNPPGAILFYHTSEYAYQAHEAAFRGGNTSGTRQMRDFLFSFVSEQGYQHYATYRMESNTLTLWLMP